MDNCLELIQQHQNLNCKVGRRWARVIGLEDYFLISDDGILRRLPRTINYVSYDIHRPQKDVNIITGRSRYGYYGTRTGREKKINIYPHIEVAKAFVPNSFSYKYVHHIDGNRSNNHYTNLRWDKYAMTNPKLSPAKVIKIREDIKNGCSIKSLSELYKVHWHTIADIRRNKTWKHIK